MKQQKRQQGKKWKTSQAAYWKQWAGRKHMKETGEDSMQVRWRKEQEIGRRLREGGVWGVGGGSLSNYWTRLGSWGNLSGTRSPRWWGCGRQDHMEGGLWLCSLKLVTRLLPSPWAECEMRLARPNVLHMHHLCHKTNLITVNYVAAIIRRGPATQAHTATRRRKYRHT